MNSVADTQNAIRQANSSLINNTKRRNPGEDSLGKEDFLNLLMTQVTHQDPLNPMDSQGMMNQLTSMGSLEQLITLNKQMGSMNETQQEIVRSSVYTFLDKDVTVKGGTTQVTGGVSQEMQFQLPREAAVVDLLVTNKEGHPVRSLELGQMAPGHHNIPWDGKDNDGDDVADGNYSYKVTARTVEDQNIPVALLTRGKVNGISFFDGKPQLMMNGGKLNLSDVLEVSNASERIFSGRAPQPLHEEMRPKPPSGVEEQ